MSNVIKFYSQNADFDPDVVLEKAIGEYSSVIVVGYDKDDILDVRVSQNLTHAETLWIIESFKRFLLNGDYKDD